jgi:hypothetical protein
MHHCQPFVSHRTVVGMWFALMLKIAGTLQLAVESLEGFACFSYWFLFSERIAFLPK